MGHTNKQSQLWNLVKVWVASVSICMYAVNCAKCVIIPHMVYHGVWPSLAIVWVTPRAHVTLSLPLSRRFSSLLPTSAASTRALSQSKRPILHANREPWINYHRTHSFKLFPQNITFWNICNMNKLETWNRLCKFLWHIWKGDIDQSVYPYLWLGPMINW